MHNKTILLILSICALAFSQTQYGDMVLPPGAFLWLNPDARSEAMGGASVTGGGAGSAGWSNPAAIVDDFSYATGMSYSYLRDKTGYSSLYGTGRLGDWAGSMRLFLANSNDIEARTGPSEEPDYTFDSHQLYTQLSAARRIRDIIDLGVSAKWIHERIDQENRDGWVFDFGVVGIYKFVRGGISLSNLGNEVVFEKYRERYPITYRAGISSGILDYGSINIEWIKPDKLDGWVAVGVEGYIGNTLKLRCGYTPGHDTRNISAGMGVTKSGFGLDYSLTNYSDGLGLSHQVTLSFAASSK